MRFIEFPVEAKQVEKFKRCPNFHMLISKEFTIIRLKRRKCSLEK
jgi:hypothetical protein